MISQDLSHLEKSVENADTQLSSFATKITAVENLISCQDDATEEYFVKELLESMTEVKNEYQNLQKDIKEVQQLQKEMTISLRHQMRVMSQTFQMLKKKIELRNASN